MVPLQLLQALGLGGRGSHEVLVREDRRWFRLRFGSGAYVRISGALMSIFLGLPHCLVSGVWLGFGVWAASAFGNRLNTTASVGASRAGV